VPKKAPFGINSVGNRNDEIVGNKPLWSANQEVYCYRIEIWKSMITAEISISPDGNFLILADKTKSKGKHSKVIMVTCFTKNRYVCHIKNII